MKIFLIDRFPYDLLHRKFFREIFFRQQMTILLKCLSQILSNLYLTKIYKRLLHNRMLFDPKINERKLDLRFRSIESPNQIEDDRPIHTIFFSTIASTYHPRRTESIPSRFHVCISSSILEHLHEVDSSLLSK